MTRARPLVWLYTIAGVRYLPLHDLAELKLEQRLGDLDTLEFTIRAEDPKAFALLPDVLVEYDGVMYRVEELTQLRDGPRPLIRAYCEARWMDLGKRSKAGSFSALGVTALAGLESILLLSGWTAAVTPADAAVYSMEDLDASLLSLVRRWAGIVGREVEFDTVNRTVTLVTAIGDDRGIGFRWGHNLRSVERRYRPPVATRLYPFGANNLDISGVEVSGLTYVENYDWYTAQGLTLLEARDMYRKDQVWVDTRYLLALNLYDAGTRRLAALSQPTISYELAVADFARLTASTADDVAIGDTVRVRDASFNIDLTTRVVRIIRHDLEPELNELELDYLQPGLGAVETAETSRSIDYGEVSFLVDDNLAALTVTSVNTELAAIQVTSTGQATFIHGASIKGTATGTGTIRYEFTVNGVVVGPSYDFAFTAGQTEFSWPSFATGVDASNTVTLAWRARITAGAGTVAIAASEARAWVLSRGAVGIGVNNNPNQSVEETLADELDGITDSVLVEIINPVDLTLGETFVDELDGITDSQTITLI